MGAYAWIMLLGRNGVITNFLSRLFGITMPDIYGFNGILLVFVTQLFPLVFLYVQGAMSKMDASLLEASETWAAPASSAFQGGAAPDLPHRAGRRAAGIRPRHE